MVAYLNPPAYATVVEIEWDRGGRFDLYAAQTDYYRRQNIEVRLGHCASACTFALSLPNVCVYPSSELGFHLPHYRAQELASGGRVMPIDFWTQKMLAYYPQKVRARLGGLTDAMMYLSGEDLIQSGVKQCVGEQPSGGLNWLRRFF